MIAIRFDALTYLTTLSYNSTAVYMVVTTSFVPTAGGSVNGGRAPSIVYVLDGLVSSYQSASNWNEKTIRPLSQLPTDYPACPWIDDLRQKGFIE